ncbi:hypothetical protein [Streptomyces sp. TR02-1]|uniref:hypothetical protein n=1 Tax=Streptomyces sp. TR02-1 TaxID=3385977 RepID=UPI0039A3ECC1
MIKLSGPLVAVLGAPGTGKSTVTAALQSLPEKPLVWRLRDFAHDQAPTTPWVDAAIRRSTDLLGWLSDEVADRLLAEALRGDYAPTPDRPVLLEGYPGNAAQAARMLQHLPGPSHLSVIELEVPDHQTASRIARRQVCPACDQAAGGPRRPAHPNPDRPGSCNRCGGPLQHRKSDLGTLTALRRSRYHHHALALRTYLCRHQVPWHRINANQSEAAVISAAKSTYRTVTEEAGALS